MFGETLKNDKTNKNQVPNKYFKFHQMPDSQGLEFLFFILLDDVINLKLYTTWICTIDKTVVFDPLTGDDTCKKLIF